jgi:surfeit locus 1 family protein
MNRPAQSMVPAGRRFAWLAAISALAGFAVLVALGTWQLQRLQWKEALIATIGERVAALPAPLAQVEAQFARTADIEYQPVTVSGTLRHDSERHFFATWQGQSGFFVYTPLRLDDGRFVFVNRGFVPYDRKDPMTRQQGLIGGEITLTGLARAALDEKPSAIVPDNQPETNIFYWKDIETMAASAGLPAAADVVPFFVDAGDAPTPGGLPIGGVTIIDLPNNHLQYAMTWYGLAAALLAVLVAWFGVARTGGRP